MSSSNGSMNSPLTVVLAASQSWAVNAFCCRWSWVVQASLPGGQRGQPGWGMILPPLLRKGVISSAWRREADMPPSRKTVLMPARSSLCPLVGAEAFRTSTNVHSLSSWGWSQTAAGGCSGNASPFQFQVCSVPLDRLCKGWDGACLETP